MNEKNQRQCSFKKKYRKPISEEVISMLMNSVYFLVEDALIVLKDNRYRLYVKHKEKILLDESYTTLRGARIAFSKKFSQKIFDLDNKNAQWSPFYQPEKCWLDLRLSQKNVLIQDLGQ